MARCFLDSEARREKRAQLNKASTRMKDQKRQLPVRSPAIRSLQAASIERRIWSFAAFPNRKLANCSTRPFLFESTKDAECVAHLGSLHLVSPIGPGPCEACAE